MFAKAFWPLRYFAARYWPKAGKTATPVIIIYLTSQRYVPPALASVKPGVGTLVSVRPNFPTLEG